MYTNFEMAKKMKVCLIRDNNVTFCTKDIRVFPRVYSKHLKLKCEARYNKVT